MKNDIKDEDYLGKVLDAINAVPERLLPEMFEELRRVSILQDRKMLLAAIASWVSTGEFHSNPAAVRAYKKTIASGNNAWVAWCAPPKRRRG